LGALMLAGETVLERMVLKRKEVEVNFYQTFVFLSAIIVMLPFLYFFWKTNPLALQAHNILIFAVVIFFATIGNLFLFYSLKKDTVTNLEPALVLQPLFVILLAIIFSFFFSQDLYHRNIKIIIPALISGFALMFSHFKKNHIQFNKYFTLAIISSIFFAIELVVSRLILSYYSPLSFYFIRSSFVFLATIIFLKPHFKELKSKIRWQIFITGAMWVLFMVITYYGFLKIGIIFTTLITMLGPVMVYLFAHIFLKEKMSWKNFVASMIIVLSVAYAVILG